MSDANTSNAQISAAETRRLFRAVQFALVAITIGLAYYNIRACQAIPRFRGIFADMLEGQALPALTRVVLRAYPVFLSFSIIIPLVVIATMFIPLRARSFYIIGCAAFLTIFQTVTLFTALSEPLVTVVDKVGAAK